MRVSIGDCRLYVDVEGLGLVPDGPTMRERPTVVVLHGGPGFDHTTFKPGFGELADTAQLVYYDHRGQGRSDRSTREQWNFAQWADDVVALCDALEIEQPIVYGVSFGSMVAMHYAIAHPAHPAKVILDSTAARLDVDAMLPVFERLGGPEAAAAAQAFWTSADEATAAEYRTRCWPLYNRRPSADELGMTRMIEHANFDLFRYWSEGEQRTFDVLDALPGIECPVLLLAGEDDPVTPISGARLVAEALGTARCTFEVFEDCGHGVWRDQAEDAFASMRRFIEDDQTTG
jgi:pimeloyl-ACP methyl ester carboxylesterase